MHKRDSSKRQRVHFWMSVFHENIYHVPQGCHESKFNIRVRIDKENPSLAITVCDNSSSLVMPNDDPRHGFFLYHPHTHEGFL